MPFWVRKLLGWLNEHIFFWLPEWAEEKLGLFRYTAQKLRVKVFINQPAFKFRRKQSIITDCYDDFLTVIIDYNFQN